MTALAVASVVTEEAVLQTEAIFAEASLAISAANLLTFFRALFSRRVCRQIMVEECLTTNLSPAFTAIHSLAFLSFLLTCELLLIIPDSFLLLLAALLTLVIHIYLRRRSSLEAAIFMQVKWHSNNDAGRAQTHLILKSNTALHAMIFRLLGLVLRLLAAVTHADGAHLRFDTRREWIDDETLSSLASAFLFVT